MKEEAKRSQLIQEEDLVFLKLDSFPKYNFLELETRLDEANKKLNEQEEEIKSLTEARNELRVYSDKIRQEKSSEEKEKNRMVEIIKRLNQEYNMTQKSNRELEQELTKLKSGRKDQCDSGIQVSLEGGSSEEHSMTTTDDSKTQIHTQKEKQPVRMASQKAPKANQNPFEASLLEFRRASETQSLHSMVSRLTEEKEELESRLLKEKAFQEIALREEKLIMKFLFGSEIDRLRQSNLSHSREIDTLKNQLAGAKKQKESLEDQLKEENEKRLLQSFFTRVEMERLILLFTEKTQECVDLQNEIFEGDVSIENEELQGFIERLNELEQLNDQLGYLLIKEKEERETEGKELQSKVVFLERKVQRAQKLIENKEREIQEEQEEREKREAQNKMELENLRKSFEALRSFSVSQEKGVTNLKEQALFALMDSELKEKNCKLEEALFKCDRLAEENHLIRKDYEQKLKEAEEWKNFIDKNKNEAELERAKEENEEKGKLIEELKEALKEALKKKKQVELKLEKTAETLAEAKKELQEAKKPLDDLIALENACISEVVSFHFVSLRMKTQNKQLKQENTRMASEIEWLRKETLAAKEQFEDGKRWVESVQKQCDEYQAWVEKYREEFQNAREEMTQKGLEMDRAKKRYVEAMRIHEDRVAFVALMRLFPTHFFLYPLFAPFIAFY